MAIKPKITLLDLCGRGFVLNTRVSARATHWIFKDDPARADAVTGNMLISTGGMPVLCSRDTTSCESLQLLYDAGHGFSATIHRFHDEHDHIRQTQQLIKQGWRMVTQHVFPVDEIPPEVCLVNPSILSYLNNKENLGKLVPEPHVPRREIASPSSLIQKPENTGLLPVVIKAATNGPSGGGYDILICRTPDDIKKAAGYFRECEKVIIEAFMVMKNNYCMNYAISNTGKITYIGASEQIMDNQGQQYGNWIGKKVNPPDKAIVVGHAIMEKASAMGYVGFAGLDMAVLKNDTVKVFDLNFRYNASTVPLLIYDSAVKHLHKPEMLFHSWQYEGNSDDLARITRNAMNQGYIIPINTYNPSLSLRPNARPLLFGLLCGGNREEVLERNHYLGSMGLT